MEHNLKNVIAGPFTLQGNFIVCNDTTSAIDDNQQQTKEIFSDKWKEVEKLEEVNKLDEFQFDWFLKLYGFNSEKHLADFLKTKKIILDTGCGLGYKAAWFARLAPESLVIGIDISDAAHLAAKNFSNYGNLFFMRRRLAILEDF